MKNDPLDTLNKSHLESILDNMLQKRLSFNIQDKPIKKGTFLLYRMKHLNNHFYIEFILKNKIVPDKIDTLKIPFPFYVECDDTDVFFDYRIQTLSRGNPIIERAINKIAKKKRTQSKFYDKILQIKEEL